MAENRTMELPGWRVRGQISQQSNRWLAGERGYFPAWSAAKRRKQTQKRKAAERNQQPQVRDRRWWS
ncbi:hypothetical protein V8E54_008776 [Elaphomyces granulatus]